MTPEEEKELTEHIDASAKILYRQAQPKQVKTLAQIEADELDNLEREEWARTLKKQHEMRVKALGMVDELAERKSMRKRCRTSEEEMEVRRRHEDVINLSDYF